MMDFNVRFDKMTKAMKTQLFIDNLTMIFNPQALFSDGTSLYRIPSEPQVNDLVRIRFRSGRENVDTVYLVCDNDKQPMVKIANDRLFDYYEGTIQLGTER